MSEDIRTTEHDDILEQEKKVVEDIISIKKITEDNAVFRRTEGGFLSLEYGGKTYNRVAVHRCFPFSDPDKFISIRDTSGDEREIGLIEDLNALSPATRELIEEQLRLRYFTPIIQKVHDVKEEYGYAYWEVTTDKGRCRFTTAMRGGSVIHLGNHRYLVTDIDGNRFEIPNLYNLSAKEIKKLDLFI